MDSMDPIIGRPDGNDYHGLISRTNQEYWIQAVYKVMDFFHILTMSIQFSRLIDMALVENDSFNRPYDKSKWLAGHFISSIDFRFLNRPVRNRRNYDGRTLVLSRPETHVSQNFLA